MSLHAILRAFHILGGTLWLGTAFFNAVFLLPSIMGAGPAGGQVMRILVQRRLPTFMNAIMGITMVAGLWLYGRDTAAGTGWITSHMGITLAIGGVLAITTAMIGFTVGVPTVKKIGKLGEVIAAAGGPPTPEQAAEMQALQRRMLGSVRLGAVLLILATIAMAVARYI